MKGGFLLLLAGAAITCAQSLDSWNTVESRVSTHGKADIILHTQFRFRVAGIHATQARIGPIVRYAATNRVSLIGGYFFRELKYEERWGNSHRYFGGLQTPFLIGRFHLTARTIAERHFGGPAPNQVQFRQLFRAAWVRRFTPSVSHETFFDQNGFLESRSMAGVSWRVGETATTEVNYIYGWRPERHGGNRQAIAFAFRFDSPLHVF